MTTHKKNSKKVAAKGKAHALTSSAAILGMASSKASGKKPANARVKPQWAKYHQHLVLLRDRLVAQMNGLAEETTQELPTYSLHMADSGTDNFDRDFALSLLSSDQDAVYEIEEALKRIEKNTFGICELTGKPIPKARLEAIPWTRFTVEAQAQLERDGALRSRRLGNLGTVDTVSGVDVEPDEDEGEEKQANKEKD